MTIITTRPAGMLALVLSAGLLAACETTEQAAGSAEAAGDASGDATAEATAEASPGDDIGGGGAAGTADAAARAVPHIYMALQPGGAGRPVSVIFAIDDSRDGTPSDEEAIRLTPDAGDCNAQEMRSYDFPETYAGRPVVSEAEAEKGLTAQDLPRFLAATVTGRMIEQGLAAEPEDTRAQNICTRKLWEQLVVNQNPDEAAAG